ncbi:hypothetical protein BaRGS_00022056 [Batillaria attramentaria]|uniref:Uncharacterized protein n=1 Tax=Batillaria attramentaria TaxID=370345 RepID=A0ABD0KI16_9CAEN
MAFSQRAVVVRWWCVISFPDKAIATIPAPLTYSDVFLLTVYKDHFHDEERDTDGNLVRPASSFVRVLRERGIPVRVVQKKDTSALQDVALQAGPEAVVATEAGAVRGLERKVVIVVQTGMTATGTTDEWYGRLDAASRTTAQLIWVVYPSNKASAAGGGDHN